MMTIEHLSYSSISKYLRCSRQWRFKYVDEIPEREKSDALLFGSAWHGMIKNLVEGELLDDAWLDSVHETLPESITCIDDWEPLMLGYKMLQSPNIATTLQGYKFWKMEQYFELNVPGVPIPVVGYVDAIKQNTSDGYGNQSQHIPIDFKTAKRKWTQDKADHDLQATMYIAMMYQAGLITLLPAKFEFHIFTKTKNPDVQILETWRDAQDLIELYNLVGLVYDAIEQGVYVPNNAGWWCSENYCDFYNRCKGGMIDERK
jgi:hypothetical protein